MRKQGVQIISVLRRVDVEVVILPLHRAHASVLYNNNKHTNNQSALENSDLKAPMPKRLPVTTHREEQPLQLRAISLHIAANNVLRELVGFVVFGGEVEEDGGGLEDGEAVDVCYGGDAAVGVFLLVWFGLVWLERRSWLGDGSRRGRGRGSRRGEIAGGEAGGRKERSANERRGERGVEKEKEKTNLDEPGRLDLVVHLPDISVGNAQLDGTVNVNLVSTKEQRGKRDVRYALIVGASICSLDKYTVIG